MKKSVHLHQIYERYTHGALYYTQTFSKGITNAWDFFDLRWCQVAHLLLNIYSLKYYLATNLISGVKRKPSCVGYSIPSNIN